MNRDIFFEGRIYVGCDIDAEDFVIKYLPTMNYSNYPVQGSHNFKDGEDVTGLYKLEEQEDYIGGSGHTSYPTFTTYALPTTPVNGEKNNQLFIRVKGLPIIEFDRNLLAEDIFEVDFGGNYKLQITNENGTFVITNAMNGFGNNCYEKFKGEKVTFLDYYDYAMSIANQNANPVNGDKGLKEFYPMQEFPEQEKDETFSKTVLLFDEGDNSFCDLGYYDFKTKEWNILGDMSMKIICWCYPPNPTEFLKGKSFTHAKHKGYC